MGRKMKLLQIFLLAPFAAGRDFYESGLVCNTTVTNIRCQNWNSNSPHNIDDQYKRFQFRDNTCRRFRKDTVGAFWCYARDPNKKWEECDCRHPKEIEYDEFY